MWGNQTVYISLLYEIEMQDRHFNVLQVRHVISDSCSYYAFIFGDLDFFFKYSIFN